MTFAGLLNQPLTIQRRSSVTTDQYGNEVPGTTASVATVGYVEYTAATEVIVDRETYTTRWLVVLPASAVVDGSDRIIHGTSTLEVVGSPHAVWNPRTRRTHSQECRCVEVVG